MDTDPERADEDTPEIAEPSTAARPRPSRVRRVLSTLAIGLVALCAVGAAVGYFWYDRATRIDRSTPTVVVFQYVDVIFAAREVDRATIFECSGSNPAGGLRALLDEVKARENRFDIRITVATGRIQADEEGVKATVHADLLISAPEANGDISRISQAWVFELKDDGGWRVCDARRES